MTNVFADVGNFNRKFGLPVSPVCPPRLLPQATQEYRERFLQEELDEFKTAWKEGDLAKAADALVDLVHVALGTAHFMYLPFNEHWAEVDRANSEKVKGDMRKARTAGLAGIAETFEIAKPPGWREPDHVRVLREHVALYFPETDES